MKKFEGVMLSVIVLTIIASSAQAIIADDKSRLKTSTFDPDFNVGYEVYVQTTIRDAQGQLLSVSEDTNAWVLVPSFPDGVLIPGFVDHVIDNNLLGEKEIITIDGVKYEKIQYEREKVIDDNWNCITCTKVWVTSGIVSKPLCGTFEVEGMEYGKQCIPLFKAKTPQMHVAEGNVVTQQWTVLRVMN